MPGDHADAQRRPLVRRLGWFVLLWVASVGAVGIVGLVIRLFLRP